MVEGNLYRCRHEGHGDAFVSFGVAFAMTRAITVITGHFAARARATAVRPA